MDDFELLIKKACEAISDEEIKKWEALEPIEPSERLHAKMEETFPFLKRNREG